MSRSNGAAARIFEGRTYQSLLLVLLVLMLVAPFFRSPLATELAYSAVILVAVSATSEKRAPLIAAVALAVLTLVTNWLGFWTYSTALIGVSHGTSLLFELLVVTLIIRSIIASPDVRLESIAGALCVYLFLGLLWADAFAVLEIIEPGTFAIPDSHMAAVSGLYDVRELSGLFTYYSLVTISTLGYGDIVPVTGPAQSLAAMEAITGQFYIAILIARLVSLYAITKREG